MRHLFLVDEKSHWKDLKAEKRLPLSSIFPLQGSSAPSALPEKYATQLFPRSGLALRALKARAPTRVAGARAALRCVSVEVWLTG